jgi:hypothetical protein
VAGTGPTIDNTTAAVLLKLEPTEFSNRPNSPLLVIEPILLANIQVHWPTYGEDRRIQPTSA